MIVLNLSVFSVLLITIHTSVKNCLFQKKDQVFCVPTPNWPWETLNLC